MKTENLTIKTFQKGLLNKDFTALEIAQESFRRIKQQDKSLQAFLSTLEDSAYQQAEEVDISLAKNEKISPIAGATIAVKDNMLIRDTKTTAASKVLERYQASYDATVIKNLREQQTVFIGKTNLDEFAMGASTENSGYQITLNPHDKSRVPGGSSGGSAVAVASGMAIAALGSDTGGSVRQPAAFCGVVGFKPTYGAVSRHGLIALASSLDQIGPITKTVEDAAELFNFLRGQDFYDSTSTNVEFSSHLPELEGVRELTVGVPDEYFIDGMNSDVRRGVEQALEDIKSLGLKIKRISMPHTKHAISCYYIIMPAEASTNLARFDGIRYSRIINKEKTLKDIFLNQRGEGFGEEVKRRILLGSFVLSSGYYDEYYAKAQKVRRLIQQDFDNAFNKVDVILTPTTPTPAFKIGEKTNDPLSMYLSDIFTVTANLAGVPAISIPVSGFKSSEGLPIGFQLMGNYGREQDILSVGRYYEKIHK